MAANVPAGSAEEALLTNLLPNSESIQAMAVLIILVFTAGAAGSALRYLATILVTGWTKGSVILATWTVNITGSFLAGSLAALAAAGLADPQMAVITGVGFLGGFTTFSTWILQIIVQFGNRDYAGAFYNLAGSLIAGTIAAVFGFYLIQAVI